jgi:hypothetical protein
MLAAALFAMALDLDDVEPLFASRPPLRQVVYRDEFTRRNVRLDVVDVREDRSSTIVVDDGTGRHIIGLHPDCSLSLRRSEDEPDAVETAIASLFALGAQNMAGIDPGETWSESASDHRTVYHARQKHGDVLRFNWRRDSADDGGVLSAEVDYDVHEVVPTYIRMITGDGKRHTLRLVADSQRGRG